MPSVGLVHFVNAVAFKYCTVNRQRLHCCKKSSSLLYHTCTLHKLPMVACTTLGLYNSTVSLLAITWLYTKPICNSYNSAHVAGVLYAVEHNSYDDLPVS